MTPDELARIWKLVGELVRAVERGDAASPYRAHAAGQEDEDSDSDSNADSDADGDADSTQSADESAAFHLPWSPEALEAQYRAAATEVARRNWDPAIAAVVAMCNVGCRTEPPQDMVQALADVVGRSVQKRDFQALLDVATAFGCGWSRNALRELPKGLPPEVERERRKRGLWDLRWDRAMTRLFALIQVRAGATIRSLHRIGVQFPGEPPDAQTAAGVVFHALFDPVGPIDGRPVTVECRGDETGMCIDEITARPLRYGARMVLEMVGANAEAWGPPRTGIEYPRPTPERSRLLVLARVDETRVNCVPAAGDGWELKLSTGEELLLEPPNNQPDTGWRRWACSCGTDHCVDRHCLAAWSPAGQSLEKFVCQAVSGVTTTRLKAGQVKQFTTGVLAAFWAAEGLED